MRHGTARSAAGRFRPRNGPRWMARFDSKGIVSGTVDMAGYAEWLHKNYGDLNLIVGGGS